MPKQSPRSAASKWQRSPKEFCKSPQELPKEVADIRQIIRMPSPRVPQGNRPRMPPGLGQDPPRISACRPNNSKSNMHDFCKASPKRSPKNAHRTLQTFQRSLQGTCQDRFCQTACLPTNFPRSRPRNAIRIWRSSPKLFAKLHKNSPRNLPRPPGNLHGFPTEYFSHRPKNLSPSLLQTAPRTSQTNCPNPSGIVRVSHLRIA